MSQLSYTPDVDMIGPAGGISVWAFGVLITIKALANETGGTYALFEDIIPPGIGPPPHTHTKEEETWYLLEGELTWIVGDKKFHATEGCFMHLPRNVPHAFVNEFDKPAHMILTYAPGGLEQWFLDVGTPVADRNNPGDAPPVAKDAVAKGAALGRGYGIIFSGHEAPKDEL